MQRLPGSHEVFGTQNLRKLHVLLADSDAGAREKMERVLGDGFVLRGVASVADAKQHLLEFSPDVLICEVRLGKESGLDLCRHVRAISSTRHLPIMLLTSLATLSDKVAGFDAGADDYVVKPYDARQMVARIRLLVRLKRLQYSQE